MLFAFASCGEKEPVIKVSIEEPEDLIPQDKMIQVIADVHLLEAALQYSSPRPASRQPFSITPTEQIPQSLPANEKPLPYYDVFAKYGYTRDQYERSLKWYAQDPVLYGEIYDEVINELVLRQAKEQSGAQPTPVPTAPAK
jgi:hypothetical protein